MTTTITSTGHDYSILPMRELARDPPHWVWIQLLRVNWAQSSARDAATEWAYPWIGNTVNQRWSRKAIYWSTQFQYRINRSYDYIPSNRAICTYLHCIARPIIPTDTLLERIMPTEIDNTINETHLRTKISLRMKHHYRHERLHERSALTEKTPYDWCTFTIRRFPMMEVNYSGDTLHSVKCI